MNAEKNITKTRYCVVDTREIVVGIIIMQPVTSVSPLFHLCRGSLHNSSFDWTPRHKYKAEKN